ncbi:MAG: class I SAM-dependent methyltransferase [Chloroflexi bacterium]|nr:class I SAM-dependent methyltransferase [Chloroflexota bacterium]
MRQVPEGAPDTQHLVEDSVAVNRGVWTTMNAQYTDARARAAWQQSEITWGIWQVPEVKLRALPTDVAGLDVVELGCGTAYLSAWLARRGARPVGVDPTPAQLATARRCQRELGLAFPLIQAPAEQVPLPAAAFDLAVSEYGASIWADPFRWIPEAARMLRPGGRLVFLRNSTLAVLCSPDVGPVQERLARSYFGLYQLDWRASNDGIVFHLGYGDLLRLLRGNGFEVLDLIEIQAPPDAQTHAYAEHVSATWAQQWPSEEIWVAQKRLAARVRRSQPFL